MNEGGSRYAHSTWGGPQIAAISNGLILVLSFSTAFYFQKHYQSQIVCKVGIHWSLRWDAIPTL
jgi:hypothetical protein